MVKNTEPEVVAKPKKNQLKKAFYKLLFFVAVAGAAYVLWKNPQLTQKIRAALNSNNTVEATSGLEGQLSNLNAQLQICSISSMNWRIARIREFRPSFSN